MTSVVPIAAWPGVSADDLVAESEQVGFRFLRRWRDEWLSGANCFAGSGEMFLLV